MTERELLIWGTPRCAVLQKYFTVGQNLLVTVPSYELQPIQSHPGFIIFFFFFLMYSFCANLHALSQGLNLCARNCN